MSKRWLPCLLLSFGLASAAYASMTCSLTAVPLQVSAEGVAEPVGEIVLRCSGGVPGRLITGSFQVSVGRLVTNRVADGKLLGPALSVYNVFDWLQLPVQGRPNGNSVVFDNIQFNVDVFGGFVLKFSGLRAEVATITQGALQFTGNEQLLVPSPLVIVAFGQTSLLATTVGAAATPCQTLPQYLEFSALVGNQAPVSTTRITENWSAAFAKRGPGADTGMRFLIQFTGIPSGARLIAPDAIAGSSALQPTQSGQMGGSPVGGLYSQSALGSLLLSRVRGALPDGSGGATVYAPPPFGVDALFGVSDAEYNTGKTYLVYEVLDSNAALIESAQVPVWIWLPPDFNGETSAVRQTVSLAPVSSDSTPANASPIPRYRAVAPQGDCAYWDDCSALYFPRMQVTPTAPPAFSAPGGSGNQIGNVLVRNTGGNLLEWRVLVRYKSGQNWITVSPPAGFNNATVRYDVWPKALAQGHYEADMVFQQINSPTGRADETVVTVTLDVTTPLPPPVPSPVVTDVVNAVTRWAMAEPLGGLITVLGTNFAADATVTIAGKTSRIVAQGPSEITVEIPLDAPLSGPAPLFVWNAPDKPSNPWGLELTTIAPQVLTILNSDDELNNQQRPAFTGRLVQLHVTGMRLAQSPVVVKIHDRWLEAAPETSQVIGVDVVKFVVPADLPSMMTTTFLCATAANGSQGCSYPKDIWLKSLDQ